MLTTESWWDDCVEALTGLIVIRNNSNMMVLIGIFIGMMGIEVIWPQVPM